MDVHALAGLYSCQIQSFDGYIQSLNPNLTYALTSLHLCRISLVDSLPMASSSLHLNLVSLKRWIFSFHAAASAHHRQPTLASLSQRYLLKTGIGSCAGMTMLIGLLCL